MSDLLVLDDLERQLSEAISAEDYQHLIGGFNAVEVMARRVGAVEEQVKAFGLKVRAEAGAAAWYATLEDEITGRPEKSLPSETTLTTKQDAEEKLGVSRKTISAWLSIAKRLKAEPKRLIEYQAQCIAGEADPTIKDLLKEVHVSQNSVENEWYTPAYIIEKAREVMGNIDLDPASSEKANETIQAQTFFDMDSDGLVQQWFGNVWLNPPYAKTVIGAFVEKLALSFGDDEINQAILLVNNATETAWGSQILRVASAVCFHTGRISFTNVKEGGTPLQGQMIVYLGAEKEKFVSVFSTLGPVLVGGVYGE